MELDPSILQSLEQHESIINRKCKQFQEDVKSLFYRVMEAETDDMTKTMFNEEINEMCEYYVLSIKNLQTHHLDQFKNDYQQSVKQEIVTQIPSEIKSQPQGNENNNSYNTTNPTTTHNGVQRDYFIDSINHASNSNNSTTEQIATSTQYKNAAMANNIKQNPKSSESPISNKNRNPLQCEICFKTFATPQAYGGIICIYDEYRIFAIPIII